MRPDHALADGLDRFTILLLKISELFPIRLQKLRLLFRAEQRFDRNRFKVAHEGICTNSRTI